MKRKAERRLSFALIWLVIMLVAGISACDKTDHVPQNEVWISGNAFSPKNMTVSKNTTVTWRNKDGEAHTVTSDTAGLFDSGTIQAGSTYTHQFTTTGTFSYHCNFHGSMTGTITVQ